MRGPSRCSAWARCATRCRDGNPGHSACVPAVMQKAPLLHALLFPASLLGISAAPAPIHCGIEMHNVALHVADGVVMSVTTLTGEFVSQSTANPPVFDDPSSYTLRVKSADVAMDAVSLTGLLRQALARHPSPLSDVTLTIENGRLQAKGKLHKGVTVPFTMTASVAASGGLLRLHAEKVKAVGVPIKGMLDLIGLDMSSLMKMPPGSGISADKDDLLLDTAALLPPPRMEATLRDAAITGTRMRLQMSGPGQPPTRPASLPLPSARNYLYFFGGSIRFGKLTMTDADMQLIDADPSTPFDFFPAHYDDQLVAGYSRNTRRKGLQVFMPDYARVRNGSMLKPPR